MAALGYSEAILDSPVGRGGLVKRQHTQRCPPGLSGNANYIVPELTGDPLNDSTVAQ